mmetsp:Transcript_43446/g.94401  ORF Transcript_43446/g.94401 Transcript_43446/m.94401 type:complete len:95 (+) Transcript_43446:487-771(+)
MAQFRLFTSRMFLNMKPSSFTTMTMTKTPASQCWLTQCISEPRRLRSYATTVLQLCNVDILRIHVDFNSSDLDAERFIQHGIELLRMVQLILTM